MNTHRQFSLVLPIKINDHHLHNELDRICKILLPSLIVFIDPQSITELIIICKSNEKSRIEKGIATVRSPFPIVVLLEDSLLDAQIIKEAEGWYLQQILKLAVARVVKTEIYMVLDTDCFLTKSLGYDELFSDGKLLMNCETNFLFGNWWENSLSLLGYSASILENKPRMGVTPEILVTSIVENLIQYLDEKSGDWQILLATNPFTEFTLYWLYCLRNNLTDHYQTDPLPGLLGNALWTIEGRPRWIRLLPKKWRYSKFTKDIARQLLEKHLYITFNDNQNYYFSLVQSGIEVTSVDCIATSLAPYLASD